jgi:SAM-dependent methyltransferase
VRFPEFVVQSGATGSSGHIAMIEYGALNRPVLDAIPMSARRILDLGCGTGSLGREVKARQRVEVTGVTYSMAEAEIARDRLDRVIVTDLNTFDPKGMGRFDCIVCSHILEHLYWPQQVLSAVASSLEPGGLLVVALPNPLVWKQRLRFLRGEFRYTDGGLMDRTHFRFFDRTSARELVTGAGFREISADACGGFPLARFLPGVGPLLSRAALWMAPGLFGWQFVIVAEAPAERDA